MDARHLLRCVLGDSDLHLEHLEHLDSKKCHVVFNLPERSLEILCDEIRAAPGTPSFGQREPVPLLHTEKTPSLQDSLPPHTATPSVLCYCYTFGSSESEVLKRLKLLLPELHKLHTAKIRQVRFVSPSKAMFCVELDLALENSEIVRLDNLL